MTDLPPILQARRNQKEAANPELSVFVTANAGSGKTTTLVDRVARLLLKRVKPGEILCVTYTKAAAAEMQARLFAKLGKWAVAGNDELRRELGDLDGRDPATLTDQDLSDARRLFAHALETPGGLKIQTIHAFCERLLRRFPLEAGVQPGFEVLEDQAALELSHGAREDLARVALGDPDGAVGQAYAHFAVEFDFNAFNELLAVIEARREALAAYLEAIEANPARGPRALLGVNPGDTVETLSEAFMAGIDRDQWRHTAEAVATGSTADQECAACMIAAMDAWSFDALRPVFLTGGKPRKRLTTKSVPAHAAAWMDETMARFVETLERVRAARIADETEKVLTLARVHAALYEAAKRARGALDFTDLVARTADLLTRRADAAWVLYKLDGGIEHVLIDEAQDTAPEQWAILRALTEPFFAGEGAERRDRDRRLPARTIFAVGDEKQSIYSFQGARPERLREEAQAHADLIPKERFKEVPLETSFRSTEEVLQFVDMAFEPSDRTRALVGEHAPIARHHPARQGQHGSVELWPLYAEPDTAEPLAWTDPVDQEGARSARKRLARDLAREIRRQVVTGSAIWAQGPDRRPILRPARYGDFLVLVRRRDATFEEIIRALKTEGVPVAGADRLKLKAHIVFDDLMALGRFALFPEDDLSLAEILRSPFVDLPDFGPADALYPLADAKSRDGRSLWRELNRRAGEQPAWEAARALLGRLIAARDRDPFAFFSTALNHVGPDGRSGRARILDRLGREAEEAIDETLAQVLAAEARGGRDLETCLALLERADVEVKREMEGARDEVRVMTVHGAKGLEAPVVILPDTTSRAKPQGPTLFPLELEDGAEAWLMCPSGKTEDCARSAEARQMRVERTDAESLRLLYVALTRARDRLIVMGRRQGNSKAGFDPGSWWDVVAETFARVKAADADAVTEAGEERLRYGPASQVLTTDDPVEPKPGPDLPAWIDSAPPAQRPGRLASPSQMDTAVRAAAPSPLLVAAGPGAPLGRFRRGDLIHRLLERLPDIAGPQRVDAARRTLARERDLDEAQRAEMIEAAFGVLDDPRFAPVFGPGSRAEVAVAGPAPELPKGLVVSGRLDRLVVLPDRVLVADFKTNRPAPDRIEDADPAYVTQMAVYWAVLRALYPDRPVEAALVWTDGPRLMAVPEQMMRDALAGLR